MLNHPILGYMYHFEPCLTGATDIFCFVWHPSFHHVYHVWEPYQCSIINSFIFFMSTNCKNSSRNRCTVCKWWRFVPVLHRQSDDKPLWEASGCLQVSRGFPFLSGAQAHRGALLLPHGMVSRVLMGVSWCFRLCHGFIWGRKGHANMLENGQKIGESLGHFVVFWCMSWSFCQWRGSICF